MYMRRYLLLIWLMLSALSVLAEQVTFTVTSASTVSLMGGTPLAGLYRQTNRGKGHLTAGHSATLYIDYMRGYQVHSVVLSMRSNKAEGAGYVTIMNGDEPLSGIQQGRFSDSWWNGAYTTTLVPITIPVHKRISGMLTITIHATANSLYIDSYTITYSRPPFGLTRHVDPPVREDEPQDTTHIVPTPTPSDTLYIPQSTAPISARYYIVAECRSLLLPKAVRTDSIEPLPAHLCYDADSLAMLLAPADTSALYELRFSGDEVEIYCPATDRYLCYPSSSSDGRLSASRSAVSWNYLMLDKGRIAIYHRYDATHYRFLCAAMDNHSPYWYRFAAKTTNVDADGYPTDIYTHLLLFAAEP